MQTGDFVISATSKEPSSVACNIFTEALECFNMIGLKQRNETKLGQHKSMYFQK